jgi:transcriptional regulator with XRE-family HTH domain
MKTLGPFYEALGQRIQQLRNKQGMTQEKLGGLLEPPVTRASIANIESGKQRVMAHTLAKLADVLDTNLSELVPEVEKRRSVIPESIEAELAEKLALPSRDLKKLTAQIVSPTRRRKEQ